nr:uncharacterized protein LOC127331828 [Lolium perenne]XP_051213989.1 uncharacterized protein LOC127331828 [Lolium perenne]XP_051213990.1 uncharacterized protein LOC127331828 [Lolium perenne]XP_051213991.1 uncharacterized protein LOC127331828 [Lolium perenne]XP_051213992.1 uncharacterized protein LOC127331828 [Lolium perenne]XP_051213993.1 uncharacterized protein LOC127331828 [Lolium perenne]XP_051213994.1 uncharacterized protein LOC127331828 [Lolium perenne]XP_051213995.1 uncharacterized p
MEALSGSPTTNPSPCSGKDRFLDPKSILCGQRRGDENPSSFRCCPAAATVCPRCASAKLRRRCDGLPTMCRRRESYDLVSQAAPPRGAAGPRIDRAESCRRKGRGFLSPLGARRVLLRRGNRLPASTRSADRENTVLAKKRELQKLCEYNLDGSVDIKWLPTVKGRSRRWLARGLILGLILGLATAVRNITLPIQFLFWTARKGGGSPGSRYVDIIFVKRSVVEVKWGVVEVWEHHSELADQLKGRPARSS